MQQTHSVVPALDHSSKGYDSGEVECGHCCEEGGSGEFSVIAIVIVIDLVVVIDVVIVIDRWLGTVLVVAVVCEVYSGVDFAVVTIKTVF